MNTPATVSWLLAALVSCPVYAEDRASLSSEDARLTELTGQYTRHYRAGAYAKAIPIAEQALSRADAVFGPEHERVAQVLNDLGQLYQSQHEIDRAARMHERALAIRERLFKADGPAVAQSLTNLAKAYLAQGRYAQAQALCERSLAIAERHVPSNSLSLIPMLESYAAALRGAEKIDAATVIESRIRQIRTGPSGNTNPK